MHRAEREITERLGVAGLRRVLEDVLDQERLIRLAHACGVEYPGMRARSQPRERLLQDVAEKAAHDDPARRAVLKTLQKETGAQRRAWDRLAPEIQAARVREGSGQELFLAASSRGAEAVETAFSETLSAPPPLRQDEPLGSEPPEDNEEEGTQEPAGAREVARLKKRNLELQKKLQHMEGQIARAREQAKDLKRDLIQRKGDLAEARMHAERLEREREARETARSTAAPAPPGAEAGDLAKAVRKLMAEQRKLVHVVEKLAATPPPPAELPADALAPLAALLEEVKRETVGSRRERRKDLQTFGQRFEELRADVRGFAESFERHLPRAKRRKGDPERVAVFVDVQNMYYGARQLKGKLDFDALLAAVVRDRRLIKATAYVVESKEIDQSGFIAMLEQRAIDVRRKTLKVRSDGSMKGDWDMEMALDILDAAPHLDVVVLVSGDGDFTSLVHRVKAMGPKVEVIAFPRNTAKSLLEAADHFQPLDRKFMIRTEHSPQAEDERPAGATVARMPSPPLAATSPERSTTDPGAPPQEPTASAGGSS